MIDDEPGSERVSALAPFRHGIFRAVWSASLASNFGGLIQAVGAAWMMTSIATSADHGGAGAGLDDACRSCCFRWSPERSPTISTGAASC